MPISRQDIKKMSRRSRDEDEDSSSRETRTSTRTSSEQTQFNPDASGYESEIKKAQEELNKMSEADQKRARGEKAEEAQAPEAGKEIGQYQGSANEERSRLVNKITQLRSEASRRGLQLTV